MPESTETYHKATLADKKPPLSSSPVSRVKRARVISSMKPSTVASMEVKESRYEPSSNLDKIYIYHDQGFSTTWVKEFIDEIKTRSLALGKRRKVFSKRNSYVLGIGTEQIVIFFNKYSTEIQYNGKKISHAFMKLFVEFAFDGGNPRVARMDASFDVHKPIEWVLKHLRISNKRRRKIHLSPEFIPETDPKLGLVYRPAPSTEYHGKAKEIVIYDPFIPHGIGPGFCRIEIRYKTMRVAPVRHFDQLPRLLTRENLFNDIHLPMTVSLKKLSKAQSKHYKKLCRLKNKHNCSMSIALAVLRRTNPSEADSAARAWKKTELDHFNFNEAFRNNLNLYLNSKLNLNEAEFLAEFVASTGMGSGPKVGPKS